MALKTDLLYRQESELMQHLQKHKFKIPKGKELSDFLRLRNRESYEGNLWYHYRTDDGSLVEGSVASDPPRFKSQETIDCLLGKDLGGEWIGGPFSSHSVECERGPTTWYLPSAIEWPGYLQPPAVTQHYARYLPPFLAAPPSKALQFYNPALQANPEAIDMAITEALGKLQGARNSARPDSTYADFAQSIAELREVSQLVAVRGQRIVSRVGSAYLLAEFGWRPVISDVQKLVNLTSALKKRIDFLKRNAGKPVKRKRLLYKFTESRGGLPPLTFGPPTTYRTVEPVEGDFPVHGWLSVEAWYHSVLSYDLPVDEILSQWEERAFRYLAGLTIDPALIWEVTPFSWLIDWITNIGDHVERTWGEKLLDVSIRQEWITIKADYHQYATVPTVAGEISSPDIAHTTAWTKRKDTFKYRMIPPADAPLELLNLISFSGKQQAILAALIASKTK
jgi:hypothetical protein